MKSERVWYPGGGVSLDSYKREVEENGYTIVKEAMTPEIVAALLSKLTKVLDRRRQVMTDEQRRNGSGYLTDLQNEDIIFTKVIFNQPILRYILISLLNDPFYRKIPACKPNYIFRGIRALDATVNGLPLHIDSVLPSSSKHPTGIVSSFILEDHNLHNGCTNVVPKTHRSDKFADRTRSSSAIAIEAAAGDLVIWDTRLWHGTGDNPKRISRLSLLCTFTSWHLKQPSCHYDTLPNDIYQQLTDEEKSIVGFCSIPAKGAGDHNHDGKFGYECLAREI